MQSPTRRGEVPRKSWVSVGAGAGARAEIAPSKFYSPTLKEGPETSIGLQRAGTHRAARSPLHVGRVRLQACPSAACGCGLLLTRCDCWAYFCPPRGGLGLLHSTSCFRHRRLSSGAWSNSFREKVATFMTSLNLKRMTLYPNDSSRLCCRLSLFMTVNPPSTYF